MTYSDVCKSLFDNQGGYYVDEGAITIFTAEKQVKKLLAINKLMNVAKYLNNGWKPDWDNSGEQKYYIYVSYGNIIIDYVYCQEGNDIYFKSEELAHQAIDILGEDEIRLVLSTDY